MIHRAITRGKKTILNKWPRDRVYNPHEKQVLYLSEAGDHLKAPFLQSTGTRCSSNRVSVQHTPIQSRSMSINSKLEIVQPTPEPSNPQPTSPSLRMTSVRSTLGPLDDTFGRHHNYLRISLTERCNLRCQYCMPEKGVPLTPPAHLLTTPEILKLIDVFVDEGVTKIRFTGGEPTLRHDLEALITATNMRRSNGLKSIAMTTNGIALSTGDRLKRLKNAGLNAVNISLDTLDKLKFPIITRREGHGHVLRSLDQSLSLGLTTKLNVVVMRGINDDEVLDFVRFIKDKPMELRFIEYMPFDGNKWEQKKMVPYKELIQIIEGEFGKLHRSEDDADKTSKRYAIEGFLGKLGFISSMSDHFCSSCNRLRITADGNLKVCLFGNNEVNVKNIMREHTITTCSSIRKESEQERNDNLSPDIPPALELTEEGDQLLRESISTAVKRKKAKHAGMTNLKNMPNRPMILIGG